MPSAVVFDCDGLLVDTEPCWTLAEVEVFARRGLDFTKDQKARFIGNSAASVGAMMAEIFDEPGNGPAVAEELLEAAYRAIADSAEAMPGAVDLVSLVAQRVPVAVASNSPRNILDIALERGGFEGGFVASVAGDEITKAKPDPEVYLATCAKLGVDPTTSVAFEDSLAGLTAAVNAGMRTVGVPTLKYDIFPAEFVVRSLADPDLMAWVAGWPLAG